MNLLHTNIIYLIYIEFQFLTPKFVAFNVKSIHILIFFYPKYFTFLMLELMALWFFFLNIFNCLQLLNTNIVGFSMLTLCPTDLPNLLFSFCGILLFFIRGKSCYLQIKAIPLPPSQYGCFCIFFFLPYCTRRSP